MKKQILVVIGNGMVGQKFLESLIAHNSRQRYDIITFGEEPRPAYDRVHLSEFFSGKTADDLSLVSPDFFENNSITFYVNDKAVRIDRKNKQISSAQGKVIGYDKLVIATGSYPFVPPVPGHDRDHCFVYRTIEDLQAITNSGKGAKVGVVVGGGLLGLEAVNALKNLGLNTHVV